MIFNLKLSILNTITFNTMSALDKYCVVHDFTKILKSECVLCKESNQEFSDPTEMCFIHNMPKNICVGCGNQPGKCKHNQTLGACHFCPQTFNNSIKCLHNKVIGKCHLCGIFIPCHHGFDKWNCKYCNPRSDLCRHSNIIGICKYCKMEKDQEIQPDLYFPLSGKRQDIPFGSPTKGFGHH